MANKTNRDKAMSAAEKVKLLAKLNTKIEIWTLHRDALQLKCDAKVKHLDDKIQKLIQLRDKLSSK